MSRKGPRRSYQHWENIPPADDTFKNQAACRDADPSIFFPGVGGHAPKAHEYCQSCPVTAECLDYFPELPSLVGVGSGPNPPVVGVVGYLEDQ